MSSSLKGKLLGKDSILIEGADWIAHQHTGYHLAVFSDSKLINNLYICDNDMNSLKVYISDSWSTASVEECLNADDTEFLIIAPMDGLLREKLLNSGIGSKKVEEVKKERRYWSLGDDEEMPWSDPHDVVEDHLQAVDVSQFTEEDTLIVYEYAPMEIDLKPLGVLDALLETLDEEYGNPNEYTKPSNKMKEAEQVFIKAVLDEYHIWACEQTGENVVVKVLEWVREHNPEWLEG
jgi:hypothetical protein